MISSIFSRVEIEKVYSLISNWNVQNSPGSSHQENDVLGLAQTDAC